MINHILHLLNQPVRMGNFFYPARKDFENISAKSVNNSKYSVIGEELLNILADLKKRVEILEEIRLVKTHWPDDHYDLKALNQYCRENFGNTAISISSISERLKHIEENHICTLTRKIFSASWQRPRKSNGRFAKKGDSNDPL